MEESWNFSSVSANVRGRKHVRARKPRLFDLAKLFRMAAGHAPERLIERGMFAYLFTVR